MAGTDNKQSTNTQSNNNNQKAEQLSEEDALFQQMNGISKKEYQKRVNARMKDLKMNGKERNDDAHRELNRMKHNLSNHNRDGGYQKKRGRVLDAKERRISNGDDYASQHDWYNPESNQKRFEGIAGETRSEFWKGVFKMMSKDFATQAAAKRAIFGEHRSPKQRRLDMIEDKRGDLQMQMQDHYNELKEAQDKIDKERDRLQAERDVNEDLGIKNPSATHMFEKDQNQKVYQSHPKQKNDSGLGFQAKNDFNESHDNFNPFEDVDGPEL